MALWTEDNSKDGQYSSRGGVIPDLHVTHTTEGHEPGDLQALTGPSVSVHDYSPARPGAKAGSPQAVIFTLVYWDQAAWHCGYGKLGGAAAPGPWTSGWNERSVGIELGHMQGEAWSTEHLARSFAYSRYTVQKLHIPRMIRHYDIAAGRPASKGGGRSDPTDFPWWDDWAKCAQLAPYSVKGSPDIGTDIWQAKLKYILDADKAKHAYQAIVARGYRPGPLLGLIGAESSFGVDGVAVTTHSWGNTRSAVDESRLANPSHTADGWPIYKTWEDGLLDVLDRLEHPDKPYLAAGNDDLTTIRMFWAPFGDATNNPLSSAYKQLGWIKDWHNQDPGDGAAIPDPVDPSTPIGTYPVSSIFLKSWLKSGGIWLPEQLTPGYARTPRFTGKQDGLSYQIYDRAAARQEANGQISWLLLEEAEKLAA